MAGVLERTLAIFELLARHPQGIHLGTVAEQLGIPRSATHRLLTELCRHGYVRQEDGDASYVLTTKLSALGLVFLSASGTVDIGQPILDRLADKVGELVRLSVIDGDRLTWVAKAQGAHSGLRYDPDMGMDAKLSCTASGHAWLSCLSDDDALELVARQGFGKPRDFGPNAPSTAQALLQHIRASRKRGFGMIVEAFQAGTSAIAAPVFYPKTRTPIGIISVAGPSSRLTKQKMLEISGDVRAAAVELGAASPASAIFNRTAARGVNTTALRPTGS